MALMPRRRHDDGNRTPQAEQALLPTTFRFFVHAILALTVRDSRLALILIVLGAFVVGTLPQIFAEGLHLDQWAANRAAAIESLKHQRGQHLVVVRYGPWHSSHQGVVYNEADIDNAKVVWALDMDPTRNRTLLAYFKDRHA
jgi:hypothetical protein